MSASANLNGGEIAVIVISILVILFLSFQIVKWVYQNKDTVLESKIKNTDEEEEKDEEEEEKPQTPPIIYFPPGRIAEIKVKTEN